MSIRGKWRIVKMPDYIEGYPDMVEPAYIEFTKSGGEFAFGCVTGAFHEIAEGDSADFTWTGSDEMDEVSGDGWAEIQGDATLHGQICFHNGDEADFIAHRW
jgi:hypothetical protein